MAFRRGADPVNRRQFAIDGLGELERIEPLQAGLDQEMTLQALIRAAEMLKKRFIAFAKTHKRELSAPVSYEEKSATKKGRPAARRERIMLISLDAPMQHVETPQTVREFLETTQKGPANSGRLQ